MFLSRTRIYHEQAKVIKTNCFFIEINFLKKYNIFKIILKYSQLFNIFHLDIRFNGWFIHQIALILTAIRNFVYY